MEQSPCWENSSHSASDEIPPSFEEYEASLPYLQQPATGPYPEPDETNPYLLTLFPQDTFQCNPHIYA